MVMFLLVLRQIDFVKILGVYDDYFKANNDYLNFIKYCGLNSDDELYIYELEINKFYIDENFVKIP